MDLDIITRYSNAQAVTTDAVSEIVNSFGSDAARNIFLRKPHIIKVIVAVVGTGGTEGIRFEFRIDTEAGLASGSQIVIGDSGIILPAQLETAGVMHQFRIRPIEVPVGYDYMGVFYNVVTTAFAGGYAFTTWLAEGAESAPAPM